MGMDTLGDRMKEYERTTTSHLIRRTPVIIRLDGRSFHTYTKRLPDKNVPYSEMLHNIRCDMTQWLVSNIQNCVFGYAQSDEISLLLVDWNRHETQQWFGGNIQKIASVSASMATVAFNVAAAKHGLITDPTDSKQFAMFDSRVHNLPMHEVCNYFIWRQQDASRNSVQMLGHFHFSQKEMHGLNNSQVQDKLMLERGVNWNDQPVWAKRGIGVVITPGEGNEHHNLVQVDLDIPVLTQKREYIEDLLLVEKTNG